MIDLDEDVILDLLPLYFAGEASAASRGIVEAYFAAYPEFADSMRAAQANVYLVPGAASPNSGHAAIKKVKTQLRRRAALIAIGIFFTIAPFSFFHDGQRLVYFALRDAPITAAVYGGVALVAWIVLWVSSRRTGTP